MTPLYLPTILYNLLFIYSLNPSLYIYYQAHTIKHTNLYKILYLYIYMLIT